MIPVLRISDITNPLGLFLNASEIYIIRRDKSRMTYTYANAQGGVDLTIGADDRITGVPVAELLQLAHAYLFNRPESSPVPSSPFGLDKLSGELSASSLPTPEQLGGFQPCTLSDRDDLPPSYRTYMSGRELNNILSFPAQQEYISFSALYIVSATTTPDPDATVYRINAPVRMRYRVMCPPRVSPSATFIDHGQNLTLVYTEPRHYSHSQTIVAGESNAFVTVQGPIINVKPLSETDIVLRPIAPDIATAQQPAASVASVASVASAAVSVQPESAVLPDKTDNYREVTVKLRFDEDHTLDVPLKLRKESTEYRLLRDGTYHGYRARRLPVRNHGDESYLIDLRLNPDADAVKSDQPKSPEFDNISDKPNQEEPSGKRTAKWIVAAVAIVILAVAAFLIGKYMPKIASLTSSYAPGEVELLDSVDTQTDTPAQISEPVAEETTETPDSIPSSNPSVLTEVEQADLDYLNNNGTWDFSRLKSERFGNLGTVFASGDLDAVARHPYFANGRCTNKEALHIATFAWRAIGSGNQRGNEQALKATRKVKSLNVRQLYEEMARIQPRDPNPEPLPF